MGYSDVAVKRAALAMSALLAASTATVNAMVNLNGYRIIGYELQYFKEGDGAPGNLHSVKIVDHTNAYVIANYSQFNKFIWVNGLRYANNKNSDIDGYLNEDASGFYNFTLPSPPAVPFYVQINVMYVEMESTASGSTVLTYKHK